MLSLPEDWLKAKTLLCRQLVELPSVIHIHILFLRILPACFSVPLNTPVSQRPQWCHSLWFEKATLKPDIFKI